ncbi:MAG: magnesium transporter [Clostridia bacterium]|nr:magnesium transporter [Clostridia bacterium]
MEEKIIELLKSRKIMELKLILNSFTAQDAATLIEKLPSEYLLLVFRLLPKDLAADTFVEMTTENQELLINSFNDKELEFVMDELYVDDAVDIIEEMPANVITRILGHTNIETRKTINQLLKYPKDSAGSIMTVEYAYLKKDKTVSEAFERIREIGVDKETIYTCYVINNNRKLIGMVSAKDLMLAEEDTLIKDIMETNLIYVNTLEDKEVVAHKFQKYDLIAMPVVDNENRLVGIITVDDVIDVIQEEDTEDFNKMAAMKTSEETYFETPVLEHVKNRIVWLLLLMLSATIAGAIIEKYETAFIAVPLLIAFVPMLMDTGGNCGSQSSTMVIRGLAIGEIELKDFIKVFLKEFGIAMLVGIVLVGVNALRMELMYQKVPNVGPITLTVCLTLFLVILISKLLGGVLPILAKLCKIDPAIMASPLITTIIDTCSVLIYFNIALKILPIN